MISEIQTTPLHITGRLSGFVSLGMVKELLKRGASLDARDSWGRNAEDLARARLNKPIYTDDGIPEDPQLKRRPGAVEAFLALLADVRAAGSFKRYANAQSAAWKTKRGRQPTHRSISAQAARRRRRPPSALRQGSRCPVPVLAPLATGPRASLPDLDEVPAPPAGNLLAHPVVLAHGPRPLTRKRSFTQ